MGKQYCGQINTYFKAIDKWDLQRTLDYIFDTFKDQVFSIDFSWTRPTYSS